MSEQWSFFKKTLGRVVWVKTLTMQVFFLLLVRSLRMLEMIGNLISSTIVDLFLIPSMFSGSFFLFLEKIEVIFLFSGIKQVQWWHVCFFTVILDIAARGFHMLGVSKAAAL